MGHMGQQAAMTAMMRTVSILYTGEYISLCASSPMTGFRNHLIKFLQKSLIDHFLVIFFGTKETFEEKLKIFGKIFISATGSHMTRSAPCIQVTDLRIFRQDN